MYQVTVVGWTRDITKRFLVFNDAVEYGCKHSFMNFIVKDTSTRDDNGEFLIDYQTGRVLRSPG